MYEHAETVISALRNVPAYETIKVNDCKITRLGGMTNLVRLVETKNINVIIGEVELVVLMLWIKVLQPSCIHQ